jgi:hypothetical protein
MSSYPWGGREELWSQATLWLRSDGDEVAASVLWWPQLSPRVVRLAEQGITLFIARPKYPRLLTRIRRRVMRRWLFGLLRSRRLQNLWWTEACFI